MKCYRAQHQIGQAEMAKRLGISTKNYEKYEGEEIRGVPPAVIERFAKIAGVTHATATDMVDPDNHTLRLLRRIDQKFDKLALQLEDLQGSFHQLEADLGRAGLAAGRTISRSQPNNRPGWLYGRA